ncbi:MAG: isochorismatase family protein [Proteobacteria bacterium]|nr:isochorismatase family protein [Pseudomonadota bacterium]
MDVLLVIDMQEALFRIPRLNSDSVIIHINRLAAAVRHNGGQVIFIQHNGTEAEGLFPHSEGWQILAALKIQPADMVIGKTVCDAFYGTDLSDTLAKLVPERIIITGCATDFCVDTTIRSAVSHNLNVVVVVDGHTTADRPHLDAQAIIGHHNFMWANLLTPKAPVALIAAVDLLASMNLKRPQ